MRALFIFFIFCGAFSLWAQVQSFLTVDIENDFLDCRGHGTDRYYTAGNILTYTSYYSKKRRIWSLSMIQQAFTPSNLQDTIVVNFDYPYAGLLYIQINYQWTGGDSSTYFNFTAGLGHTGKYSGVAGLQRSLHRVFNDEMPLGWQYILEQGIFCQSSFEFHKILYMRSNRNLFIVQQWEWGTLFKKAQIGFSGNFSSVSSSSIPHFLAASERQLSTTKRVFKRFSFFFEPSVTWVISNAMLEKGLLVNTSRMRSVNSGQQIHRTVFTLECGFAFPLRAWTFLFRENWQTAESFKSHSHHFGALTATYRFPHSKR